MAAHHLTYFGLGARGFPTRVSLRKAGVPFTDERLSFPEWGTYDKSRLPCGQLPALSIDGQVFCQSIPLSAYAAKIAGLYPTEPLAQLAADEVVAIVDELWNKARSGLRGVRQASWRRLWRGGGGGGGGGGDGNATAPAENMFFSCIFLPVAQGGSTPKDEEKRVAYAKEVAPRFLKALAARLGTNTFFGGAETPQWADLWCYQYVVFFTSGFFDFIPTDFVAVAAPTIAAHAVAVKESELYKSYGTPE